MAQALTIPGGKKKGTLLEEAETADLQYWFGRITDDLDANPNKNFADRDRLWLKAAGKILQDRKGGAKPAAKPAPSQAIDRVAEPQSQVLAEGSFGDPKKASLALKQASEAYHLVSPATVCGNLPEGCELCLSLVHIDATSRDLYKLPGGKIGLDRVSLMKIASAAGATMEETRRLDDGSHPHYVHWSVTISYRLFDGQVTRRTGTVEIDTREPLGAAYVEICEKNPEPGKQLLELRKFLTRHAESKALNRAVAAMGIKRSYTAEELEKPFAVARLMFTGRSSDPEARAQFRDKIADSFLNGRTQAYGGAPQLPQHGATPVPQLHAPPPGGDSWDEDYDTGGEGVDSEPQQAAPQQTQQGQGSASADGSQQSFPT